MKTKYRVPYEQFNDFRRRMDGAGGKLWIMGSKKGEAMVQDHILECEVPESALSQFEQYRFEESKEHTPEDLDRIIYSWLGPELGKAARGPGEWFFPRFSQSLDSMHEAEKKLTLKQSALYIDHLMQLGDWHGFVKTTRSIDVICATALQRAQALVAVIQAGP